MRLVNQWIEENLASNILVATIITIGLVNLSSICFDNIWIDGILTLLIGVSFLGGLISAGRGNFPLVAIFLPIFLIGINFADSSQKYANLQQIEEVDKVICEEYLSTYDGVRILESEIANEKYLSSKVLGWKKMSEKIWAKDGNVYFILSKKPGDRILFQHRFKNFEYTIPDPNEQ